jgi:hypothetical protein
LFKKLFCRFIEVVIKGEKTTFAPEEVRFGCSWAAKNLTFVCNAFPTQQNKRDGVGAHERNCRSLPWSNNQGFELILKRNINAKRQYDFGSEKLFQYEKLFQSNFVL